MINKNKQCKECGTTSSERWTGRLCDLCFRLLCKKNYQKHAEKKIKSSLAWRELNKERYRDYQKNYHAKNYEQPDLRLKTNSKNDFNDKLRKYIAEYILAIPYPRLRESSIIKVEKMIKCSFPVLIDRMERQWLKDFGVAIDWNNLYIPSCPEKLEVEHQQKLHTFDFTIAEDVKKAWHFSNLKMLPQYINRTGRPVAV
jgi:uncharacterized UBP type Zn finger protein